MIWFFFRMPGQVLNWLSYHFPGKGEVWVSRRQLGNPVVEVIKSIVFWIILIGFAFLFYVQAPSHLQR